MKLKYKVGDVVTINPNLIYGFSYLHGLAEDMMEYRGETCVVTNIDYNGYILENTDRSAPPAVLGGERIPFLWSEEMLEGYDGFFLGNVVILPDGTQGMIASKDPLDETYLVNGHLYSKESLGRIDGYDYTRPTVLRKYEVGDFVKIAINTDNEQYGRLYVSTKTKCYNHRIGRVININSEHIDGGEYTISVDGINILCNSLMIVPVKTPKLKVGDKVYCDGVATVISIGEALCGLLLANGKIATVPMRSLEPLNEKEVVLTNDIFGIGNAGDKVSGYYAEISHRLFVQSKLSYVSGILQRDEFIVGG